MLQGENNVKYRLNLLRTKFLVTAMSLLSGCYVTADGEIIWDQDAPRAAATSPAGPSSGGGSQY